jgi:hypothetical protein
MEEYYDFKVSAIKKQVSFFACSFLSAILILLSVSTSLYAQDTQKKYQVQFLRIIEANDFINLRGQGDDCLPEGNRFIPLLLMT